MKIFRPILRSLIVGLFVTAIPVLTTCSSGPTQTAGAGSETTNSFAATILYPNGEPARGIMVKVRPAGFESGADDASLTVRNSRNKRTDCVGFISIDSLDTGAYVLEANDKVSSAAAVRRSLSAGQGTQNLDTVTLLAYAGVNGLIDRSLLSGESLYVQVTGLDRKVPVGGDGTFAVADLPAGVWNFRIVAATSLDSPLVTDSVTATAGEILSSTPGWSRSSRIFLNTTASGANVQGNILSFPILISLTAASGVDFDSCDSLGRDVRFTKADGSPLAYDIESWDKANRTAAVWVKMDTVFGNSSSQFIILHYGNKTASDQSSSATVFDTADGYAGVWHLGVGNRDATGNHNDPSASTIGHETGGVAQCGLFDGVNFLKIPDSTSHGTLVPGARSFTLSAWFSATDTTRRRIIGKGHYEHSNGFFLECRGGRICASIGSGGDTSATVYVMTVNSFTDGNWHLATAVFDMSALRLRIFVDGRPAAITAMSFEARQYCGAFAGSDLDFSACAKISTVTTEYLEIGGWSAEAEGFIGRIDEARVEMRALSPDRIKLSYENQRPGQVFLSVGQ